jgi:hypothetical protein
VTKYGSDYERERRLFKTECAATNAPCWLCNNQRGPIDYTSKYVRGTKQPLLFNLDHAQPTSLGGDAARRANFRPAHYPHLQRKPREHHTRAVPNVKIVVKTGSRGGGYP